MNNEEMIIKLPGLISFWDFQESAGMQRKAKGPYCYDLTEMGGTIKRVADGFFGPFSAHMEQGKWFNIFRKDCPALNLRGKNAQVSVVAWVKREVKDNNECEAIAGMWNETQKQRQYCLFLNLGIWDSAQQVCGHISSMGGPTSGFQYCMDASIGNTPVPFGSWQCIAFTYDGYLAKSYLNGELDTRETYNPYAYDSGLFDGGEDGSDFTVGAVHRNGEFGNWYTGLLGGLAVFNRALTEEEMREIGNI